MNLCQCYHEKEEHNEQRCSGIAEDQGVNIGCYCSGFKEQTPEWIEQQKEYSLRDMFRRWEEDTIWYKIKKFLDL